MDFDNSCPNELSHSADSDYTRRWYTFSDDSEYFYTYTVYRFKDADVYLVSQSNKIIGGYLANNKHPLFYKYMQMRVKQTVYF